MPRIEHIQPVLKSNRVMKHALAFSIILLLLGCTKSSPESEAFFQKFAAAFNNDTGEVLLTDITDFPWQDVCLFKADGPYPYVGYGSYQEHVKAKNLNGAISEGKYGLIVIFLDQGKIVQEYFQPDSYLTIHNEEHAIELASKKPFLKFCSTAEGLTFTLDKDSSSVLISKQRPE